MFCRSTLNHPETSLRDLFVITASVAPASVLALGAFRVEEDVCEEFKFIIAPICQKNSPDSQLLKVYSDIDGIMSS